jgi:GNAT superfamily N-acetyltransferase
MAENTVLVRPVTRADAADLQANCLVRNTVAEVQALIEDNLRLAAEGKGIHLVAELAGQAVGMLVLVRNGHPLYNHRADLFSVVVCYRRWRQGIARRLVQEALARARQMGVTILETSCRAGTPAEEVYRHLGFREYGRLPGGMVEPWGDRACFDQTYLYQPADDPAGAKPEAAS